MADVPTSSPPTTAHLPRLRLPTIKWPGRGFFPRGPGPGLLIFALLIGLAPSLYGTMFIVDSRLDGGFYMTPEFIVGQRQALAVVGMLAFLSAVFAFLLVARDLWHGQVQGWRYKLMAVVLVATVAWDAWFFPQMHNIIDPALSDEEVAWIAEQRSSSPGVAGFRYDGQVFAVDITMEDRLQFTAPPIAQAGPELCKVLGGTFRGPVEAVGYSVTFDDNSRHEFTVSREDCRAWYLTDRRFANQPVPAWRLSPRHLSPLFERMQTLPATDAAP